MILKCFRIDAPKCEDRLDQAVRGCANQHVPQLPSALDPNGHQQACLHLGM